MLKILGRGLSIILCSLSPLILLFFAFSLATDGTFELWGIEELSGAYDSLATNLLRGSAEVDRSAISWEGSDNNGRFSMYFGALPGFLRIVFHYFDENLFGQWGRLSCLIAFFLSCLLITTAILRSTMQSLPKRPFLYYPLFLFSVIGLSSPLLFLIANPGIYHEAIIWGTAMGLGAVSVMLEMERRGPSLRLIGALGIFSGLAMLARVTFAIPSLIFLPFSCLLFLRESAPPNRIGGFIKLLLALLPFAILISIQAWYNHWRYGLIFQFAPKTTYFNLPTIGGYFNFLRIPSALLHYFIPLPSQFSSIPPFIYPRGVAPFPTKLFPDWTESVLTLTLSSFWLCCLALAGIVRFKRFSLIQTVIVLATLAQVIMICSAFFITERYSAEILPFLVVLTCIALQNSKRLSSALLSTKGNIILCVSVLVNMAGVASWIFLFASYVNVDIKWAGKVSRIIQNASFSFTPKTPMSLAHLRLSPAHFSSFPQSIYLSNSLNRFLTDNTFPFGFYARAGEAINLNTTEKDLEFQAFVGVPQSLRYCSRGVFDLVVTGENDRLYFGPERFSARHPPKIINFQLNPPTKELKFSLNRVKVGNDCDMLFFGAAGMPIPRESIDKEYDLKSDLVGLKVIESKVTSPHPVAPYQIISPLANQESTPDLRLFAQNFVTFSLPKCAGHFTATTKIARYSSSPSYLPSARLSILSDGETLRYFGPVLRDLGDISYQVSVPLSEAKTMSLILDPVDVNFDGDIVNLSNAYISHCKSTHP